MPVPVRRQMAALVAAMFLAVPTPASAATSVGIDPPVLSGGSLSVSGKALFAHQPMLSLGSDPAGDQLPPGPDVAGKDLIDLSMATGLDEMLTIRWKLAGLSPATGRGADVSYGTAFCVEPGETCYAITFVDTGALNSFVWGWTCPDESCAISSGHHTHSWETDAYDTTAGTASARIPLADLGISPGSRLRAVPAATFGATTWVASPWWFLQDVIVAPPTFDRATTGDYLVPGRSVTLAVGKPGHDPVTLDYPVQAPVDGGDRFAATLDVSGLAPGEHAVYVRACYGGNNCGYASRVFTL